MVLFISNDFPLLSSPGMMLCAWGVIQCSINVNHFEGACGSETENRFSVSRSIFPHHQFEVIKQQVKMLRIFNFGFATKLHNVGGAEDMNETANAMRDREREKKIENDFI